MTPIRTTSPTSPPPWLATGLATRPTNRPATSARTSLTTSLHGALRPAFSAAFARPLGQAAAALAMALALVPGHTQTVPNGRLLASNCFQCHGTNGKGPGFDRLAGQSASSIYGDLKGVQSGKEGNGIMAKHALGYTDALLQALSQWLSTQR